jgi:Putative zinc-finger
MGAGAEGHLEADEVVAYVDRAVAGDERLRIEAHLTTCAECRAEVSEIVGVVRTMPKLGQSRRRYWIPAAAAAVLAIVLAWPRDHRGGLTIATEHRQGAVTTTIGPRPIAPAGETADADTLVWSAVPGADGYAVRLFDANSTVLWETQTIDTVAPLPSTIGLRAGATYYWKVEARAGFDRWVSSELVEFVLPNGRASR